jgi:hypothetical protein
LMKRSLIWVFRVSESTLIFAFSYTNWKCTSNRVV